MSGARRALIVAQGSYSNSDLTRLASAAEDARALARTLGDPEIGGFEVDVAQNEPSHEVARRVETFFSSGRRDDSLLLYFSCHGIKNPSGKLFFAAQDTEPNLLLSTAVSAQFVRQCMSSCRARNSVLFLDCCFGGAFMDGMSPRAANDVHVLDTFPAEEMASGRGWAVVTASSAMEYAFEGRQLTRDAPPTPSVFTSALVNGLTSGAADLDEDGLVSLDELYSYLYEQVRAENPDQTPNRTMHTQGSVFVARSTRHHRALEPLPADLRKELLDQDPAVQASAAARLETAANGTDISAAQHAHDALTWLAKRDAGPLAEQAGKALDRMRIAPLSAVLRFGRIAQGSPPPTQMIRLLGPPLARHCTARAHSPVLRVERPEDALDDFRVTLSTGRLGTVDTAVTLTGPLGEAHVVVTAEVVPVSSPVVSAPFVHPLPAPPPAPVHVPPPAAQHRPTQPRHFPLPMRRFWARFVDLMLLTTAGWGVAFAVVMAISLFTAPPDDPEVWTGSTFDVLMAVWMVVALFGWGLLVFLHDALLIGTHGRTIGMAVLGIRVVDARSCARPHWRQAYLRAAISGLPHTIPVLGQLFVLGESLAMLSHARRMALHDQAAKTLVVFSDSSWPR